MESKHTPGPWKYGAMNKHRQIRIAAAATPTSTYLVALVEPDCPDDLAQEANARLIESAPDLLEACKQAQAGTGDWRAALDAAIAKAEGGAE